MKTQDRNYRLLEYLNVNTRTSYLARIRNPNPKMPDAARIAVASTRRTEKHSKIDANATLDARNGAKPSVRTKAREAGRTRPQFQM